MGYTDFYCQSGGSNLNSGSTTSNSATYTATNGNWSTATNQYIPTDGSTPASSVNVGDFASIYIDGASVGVFIGRITVVAAGVNGAITISAAARAGVPPVTSATARTIKVGGAWLGPNAGSGFPLSLTAFDGLVVTNIAGETARINLLNDAPYSISTAITPAFTNGVVQGYSSSTGDKGKAIIDTSTNIINALVLQTNIALIDLIFYGGGQASGSAALVSTTTGAGGSVFLRCIAHGSRGNGFTVTLTATITFIECEAYDNNKSNSADLAGFKISASTVNLIRCYSHDNTGANSIGFNAASISQIWMANCIADTNGGDGFQVGNSTGIGGVVLNNCDAYNNGRDGIRVISKNQTYITIHNCNLVKNTGWGINVSGFTALVYGEFSNCGYGSGTQANGSGTTNATSVTITGTVTYGANLTPWFAPATGDFRIALAAAVSTGVENFLQTGSAKTGAIGYPDIGAAQSLHFLSVSSTSVGYVS